MKTAEEIIIEKVGEFWWICGKHRPEFIEAMNEFKNQKEDLLCNCEDDSIPIKLICSKCGKVWSSEAEPAQIAQKNEFVIPDVMPSVCNNPMGECSYRDANPDLCNTCHIASNTEA